jgi:hypothetical protein
MLGMKSTTWAVSKEVGVCQTLASTPVETERFRLVLIEGGYAPANSSWRRHRHAMR